MFFYAYHFDSITYDWGYTDNGTKELKDVRLSYRSSNPSVGVIIVTEDPQLTKIIIATKSFCDQHFDHGPTLGETIGKEQCENPTYQINYKSAKLIVTNIINKTTFKIGENITVIPELTNIGNHNVTIDYCGPLFVTLTIDQFGKIVWPQYSWACPLIGHEMTLVPNVPTPGDSYGQIISLYAPGNYTITSIASFGDISNTTVLWSKPIQITILPGN